MRRKLTMVFAAFVLGLATLGCGNDSTGNSVPTTNEQPKEWPVLPGKEKQAKPTSFAPS